MIDVNLNVIFFGKVISVQMYENSITFILYLFICFVVSCQQRDRVEAVGYLAKVFLDKPPRGSLQGIGPIITKTSPCNEYLLTPHFYIVKLGFTGVYLTFLFLL